MIQISWDDSEKLSSFKIGTPQFYSRFRKIKREVLLRLKVGVFDITTFSQENRPRILINDSLANIEFFQILEESGMFSFHQDNSGKSIQISQIAAFFKQKGGWFDYWIKGNTYGKNDIHVHHLDHDTSNNLPENLCYVTPKVNNLATQFTQECLENPLQFKERKAKLELLVILENLSTAAKEVILKTYVKTKNALAKVEEIVLPDTSRVCPISLEQEIMVIPGVFRWKSLTIKDMVKLVKKGKNWW